MPKASPRLLLLAALLCPAVARPQTALTVNGDVPHALTLAAADLAQMTRETAVLRQPNGEQASYQGVPLREILRKAGAPSGHDLRGKALTAYFIVKAHDGYRVIFTLAELDADFSNRRVLVADKRDGRPLPAREGPLRLIVPDDQRPARSVRMLEEIQVVPPEK